MRKIVIIFLVIILIGFTFNLRTYAYTDDVKKVIIVLEDEINEQSKYENLFKNIDYQKIKVLTKGIEKEHQTRSLTGETNTYNTIIEMELDNSSDVEKTIQKLGKNSNVKFAIPDLEIFAIDEVENINSSYRSSGSDIDQDDNADLGSYYNDILYTESEQWAITKIDLHKTINLYPNNNNEVVVGILDTGVDITHEELQGIVDEELSKDFTSNNTDLSLVDDEGHGTAIASIIAAHTNNSRGIVGVCNNVKIVSLKVLDSGLKGYLSNVIEAVEYANENNIDIINLSLTFRQGFTSNYNVDPKYIDASITLLENAISNYSGLAVCAAGNEETNIDGSQYVCVPAKFNLSNLITVGASTSDDTIAEFSNYGLNSVDLFAPGEDILFAARLEECEEICQPNLTYHIAYGYHKSSGTSYATPYVVGAAALLLSKEPTLSPTQIKSAILNNVDLIPALNGKCLTGGRLNVDKALRSIHVHQYECVYYSQNVHAYTCSCGFTINYETHNAVNHYCSMCNTQNQELHTFVYSKYSDQKHKITCRYCNYTAYGIHVAGGPGNRKCTLCNAIISGIIEVPGLYSRRS